MYNKTVGEGIPLVRIPTVRRMYACMLCVNVKQNVRRPFASSVVILAIAATTKHNVCVYVCVYVHVCVSLSVCLSVCVCMFICVCIRMYTYIRTYVCVCIFIYTYTNKQTHIYTCMHISRPPATTATSHRCVRLCYLGPGNGYYYELN
jgi:hypothetical protein